MGDLKSKSHIAVLLFMSWTAWVCLTITLQVADNFWPQRWKMVCQRGKTYPVFSEPFPYFRPLSAWLHIIGSRQSVTSHQGPHWGKPLCKSGASCSIECAIWFFWHISDTFRPHTPTLHIFYFAQCKRSTTPSPSANCENLEFCFCFYIFDSTGVQ